MIKQRMPKRIAKIRQKIISVVWEAYKGAYTMEELAQVFKMDTANFFRQIKSKRDEKK